MNEDLDEELDEIAVGEEAERLMSKWVAIEAAAGTEACVRAIAEDIVSHYEERTGPRVVFGKAMVVCMSRGFASASTTRSSACAPSGTTPTRASSRW